ncbi:MAG: formylglycine-generating enzyme family protein, partial [Spirochaetaceae bacterium]|nr:formylglycine-generating enzyme family protein [Spirochaetaceae bacterium]
MSGKIEKNRLIGIVCAIVAAGLLAGGCNPIPFEDSPLPDRQKMDIPDPGDLGAHEVTYELWYTVRVWAETHGYSFQNKGWEGGKNTGGGKPSGFGKNLPVTGISWRDAIVWCNAYSEMSGFSPVYIYQDITVELVRGDESMPSGFPGTPNPAGSVFWYEYTAATPPPPLKISGAGRLENGNVINLAQAMELCNRIEIDSLANGFRLPTVSQWEIAAGPGTYAGESGSGGVLKDF